MLLWANWISVNLEAGAKANCGSGKCSHQKVSGSSPVQSTCSSVLGQDAEPHISSNVVLLVLEDEILLHWQKMFSCLCLVGQHLHWPSITLCNGGSQDKCTGDCTDWTEVRARASGLLHRAEGQRLWLQFSEHEKLSGSEFKQGNEHSVCWWSFRHVLPPVHHYDDDHPHHHSLVVNL